MTVAAFEFEAKKWVDVLLDTPIRIEGMLTYLARNYEDAYVRVGHKRHQSMIPVALSSIQTMALAKLSNAPVTSDVAAIGIVTLMNT